MIQKDETGKIINRPWGYYKVIEQGEKYCVKIIHVNVGQKLSVQSHNYRSEHWVVASGKAYVILDENEFNLDVGQSADIPVKAVHSLQNPFEQDLEIVELQMGEIISEDDIIRYSDIYGRV